MKVRMIVASLFIMMTLSACGGKEDIPEADSSIPESENVYTEETDKIAETGSEAMTYRTEEIMCEDSGKSIYGVAYIPSGEGKFPLVIFSHELGNNHEAGSRYGERLAENGIAAYTFDFRGGSVSGKENRSSGSNSEMSVMTESDDLKLVINKAKTWDFVDTDNIFLLGGSQGGLVTIVAGTELADDISGMMLMYPALSIKEDHGITSYASTLEVPDDVGLFGGWMHVGKNYVTDIWDTDFYELLKDYDGNVLLLHGDKDTTVPLSYSERASGMIKNCEFHVIENGGHEFYDQPFEDAMGYILQYLDRKMKGSETVENREDEESVMTMKIGESPVQVDWEDNESVEALKSLAKQGDITIQMSMYGGFEQVGSLGESLPRNDKQTTTKSGDIVLYSGNQIVIFYGSNSWAYTRLGHISDKDESQMEELLSNGDETVTISAKN